MPTASSGSTILTNSVAAREIFADNKKATVRNTVVMNNLKLNNNFLGITFYY